jgi:peptidoglycan/xylan/chitin deacetylase (PgdA/CDA1 family)
VSDVLLLCYHAVSESWPAPLAIGPEDLKQHVGLLARRGYQGVTFREAVGLPRNAKAVAITFDDAYRSVIEHALPILADAGFPATVFAPTGFIGTDEPMSWPGTDHWLSGEHVDELMPMRWDALGELAGAGWEVGSHTRSHPRLTDLDGTALEAELRDSRDEIEGRLGTPCLSLAYPYGRFDQRVIEAAERAGYTAAAATLPGRLRPPTGHFDWPRIVVNRVDRVRRFGMKISPLVRTAKSSAAWDLVAAARRAAR